MDKKELLRWLFAHNGRERTGKVWAKELEVEILDPDGWRRGDGVTLSDKITLANFIDRLAESTIFIG